MKTVPRERFSILYILVDFPSRGIGKIKGEFRTLRSPASLRGWTAPVRRPGPACRLRRDWCGALLAHAEIREDMIYDIILNTLTSQFSKALNRALDIIYHGIGRKTGF